MPTGRLPTTRFDRLRRDWATLVGPDIAGIASPHRLSGHTLTLVATGPAAIELQYRATGMIETINATIGQRTVTSLRFLHGEPCHMA